MKKLIVIAFAALCCASTQAAYLYWQVTDAVATEYSGANYAQLKQDGVMIGAAEVNSSSSPAMSIEVSAVNGDSGSFYIELFNYENGAWNSLAVSETKSYSQLAATGALTTTLVSIPTAWTGGTYSVPEPTSGVLMLIGLAGLALKRRKI